MDDEMLANLPLMTEQEFVDWEGGRRVEWVDGKVVFLAPDSGWRARLKK